MPKETVLDDSADIYKKRDDSKDYKSFKDMSSKEKWTHFKEYYLLKTILIIVGVIIVSYLVYTFVKPRTKVLLHVTVINDTLDEKQKENMISTYGKKLNINKSKETITIDDTCTINDGDAFSSAVDQKISTQAYSQELDIIIADEKVFKEYAQTGFFADLSKALPKDTLKALSSSLYKTPLMDTDTQKLSSDTYPFGICLDASKLYTSASDIYQKKYGNTTHKLYIGIVNNTKRLDNSVGYINYLFNLSK